MTRWSRDFSLPDFFGSGGFLGGASVPTCPRRCSLLRRRRGRGRRANYSAGRGRADSARLLARRASHAALARRALHGVYTRRLGRSAAAPGPRSGEMMKAVGARLAFRHRCRPAPAAAEATTPPTTRRRAPPGGAPDGRRASRKKNSRCRMRLDEISRLHILFLVLGQHLT